MTADKGYHTDAQVPQQHLRSAKISNDALKFVWYLVTQTASHTDHSHLISPY